MIQFKTNNREEQICIGVPDGAYDFTLEQIKQIVDYINFKDNENK